MKKLKQIGKYIILFILVVIFLMLLLVLVAMIPNKYVKENLLESVGYFEEYPQEINAINLHREYTYLHPFADSIIFNIINCMDENHPFKTIIEDPYYASEILKEKNNACTLDYTNSMENNLKGNCSYARYWHGSIVIIKLLLIVFNIEQIYIFLKIMFYFNILIFLGILIKKKYYKVIIAFILGSVMISIWYVPLTFEYIWTFFIMFIVSIIAILLEDKNKKPSYNEVYNKKLYILFFISGIITCYFDFLTTEIITILVPLILILTIRLQNQTFTNIKQEGKFILKAIILWFIAYTMMWLTKWVISAIVLNTSIVSVALNQAMYRINGQVSAIPKSKLPFLAIKENFDILIPIILYREKVWEIVLTLATLIIVTLLILDRKNKTKIDYMILMIFIAIVPYIRYFIMANHSYRHSFFTFRSQLATMMCIILIICCCTSKDRLFSKIKR